MPDFIVRTRSRPPTDISAARGLRSGVFTEIEELDFGPRST